MKPCVPRVCGMDSFNFLTAFYLVFRNEKPEPSVARVLLLKHCNLFGLGLERKPQVAVNLIQELLGIPGVEAFEQHHTGGFDLPIA